MMRVVEVGEEFDGDVMRVESYGAFVEYLPGREGLVHVSRMSTDYVADANEKVKVGDTVHVRIAEIKEDGKIGLSMLTAEEEQQQRENGRNRGGQGGGDRGGHGARSNRGGGFRSGRDRGDRERRGGGFRGRGNFGDRDGRGQRGGFRSRGDNNDRDE